MTETFEAVAAQVALVADRQSVEAFAADGADEAVGVGVRDGRSGGCPDDADTRTGEDGVGDVGERGELGGAIVDQKPRAVERALDCEVAGQVRDPCAGRVAGDAGEMDTVDAAW